MLDDYQVIVKVKQQQFEDLIREQAQLRLIRQAQARPPGSHRVLAALGRWMARSGERIQSRFGNEGVTPVPVTGRQVYDC